MLHVHYFITRKSSMSDAEFHRYWRETHGPIAARIPQLHRYVQSHRITAFGSQLALRWRGRGADRRSQRDGRAPASPEYLDGALADERNFIDLTRVEWMVTRDHVVLDGPTGGNLIKGVWQLVIKPGMALDDFRKYWLEVHGPMALKLPGLRRYVQSHLIDEAYLYAHAAFRRRRATMVRQSRGVRRGLRVAGRQRLARRRRVVYRRARNDVLHGAGAYPDRVALNPADASS